MAAFPRRLVHSTGAPMELDEHRVLLATRDEVDRAELADRLANARAVLEDGGTESDDARRMERVNHTPTRFWLRTTDREPFDEGRLRLLREVLGDVLAWVGPVYRLGGHLAVEGRRGLVAPLPHVVLVRLRRGADVPVEKVVSAVADDVEVTVDRERSPYLAGLQRVLLPDPERLDAFVLRDRLLEGQRDVVVDVRLESMPLVVPTALIPDDTLWAQQWDMTQIEAPGAWDISTGSASVVVCVLDEGIDLTHPDLVLAGTGINLGTMSGDGAPTGSHGTACAGIVAATVNNAAGVAGVAGSTQLLPAAFVAWTDVEVASGIGWAQANGAAVISMSFGWNAWDPLLIDPTIQAADAAGVVMAVATHNHDGAITYPATNPLVIAVGASDQVDERKSPTSPDGEAWGSNFGPEISVVAPGVLIPTTDIQGTDGYNVDGSGGTWAGVPYPSFGPADGDYVTVFDGTSAATPHVAGLAALLLGAYPTLTSSQVRRIIERTADKAGSVAYVETVGYDSGTWNEQTGYGRINARKAVDLADVMIRDWPGDVGLEPSAPAGGNFWNFADVVVRITDDGVFNPGDPMQSQHLERGQTNFLYVRVRNEGPREARDVVVDARITPFVGTQFVYPTDWTAVDATHLAPTPVTAQFATIPAGGEEIATFTISSAQVEVLHSNAWHPCVVVSVDAENDYAFDTAAFVSDPVVTRINNLAQRNLSVIDVLADPAGATATFPFLAGNALDLDRSLELVVDRSGVPQGAEVLLALDRGNRWFPEVDVDEHVEEHGEHGERDGCGDLEVLERTRVRTRLGCCEGVLTLEKGSRFECDHGGRRVRDVVVRGGEVVERDGERLVRLDDRATTVRLGKAAGRLLPLELEVRLPDGTEAGQHLMLSVAQRDAEHQVVGGASALLVTR